MTPHLWALWREAIDQRCIVRNFTADKWIWALVEGESSSGGLAFVLRGFWVCTTSFWANFLPHRDLPLVSQIHVALVPLNKKPVEKINGRGLFFIFLMTEIEWLTLVFAHIVSSWWPQKLHFFLVVRKYTQTRWLFLHILFIHLLLQKKVWITYKDWISFVCDCETQNDCVLLFQT